MVTGIDLSTSALETYRKNLGDHVRRADMRTLSYTSLPKKIDVVVGSPPCTQFSYSNRGGSGDLNDGIVDLQAFLSAVDHIQPKFWVMENVPRVAKIFESEMLPGGKLEEYSHLVDSVHVVDLAEFGLPQRRRRCIIGKFPDELLFTYREETPTRAMKDVINSFKSHYYDDEMFGARVYSDELSDHDIEDSLTDEEVRLNLEAKTRHPVYNGMRFPDSLDRPARTLTATCTKVSRESIVIDDERTSGSFRRLTLRERASLQGFPGDFQFFAPSYAAKIRLIGNALPPLFSYYVGCALRGVSTGRLRHPWQRKRISLSPQRAPNTKPRLAQHRMSSKRRFRAVIPGFRFNSGMRLQMSNTFVCGQPKWIVDFHYGSPKDIRTIGLEEHSLNVLISDRRAEEELVKLNLSGAELIEALRGDDPHSSLQEVWTHQKCGIGPFEVVDQLGRLGEEVGHRMRQLDESVVWEKLSHLLKTSTRADETLIGKRKIVKQQAQIYAGMIVGCWFNSTVSTSR